MPGMKVIAANGRAFSSGVLHDAIKAAKGTLQFADRPTNIRNQLTRSPDVFDVREQIRLGLNLPRRNGCGQVEHLFRPPLADGVFENRE